MSGRTKGKRGEREAIKALRLEGLDARGVRREAGATPDVDAVIFLPYGRCSQVQIKREERAAGSWIGEFVAPGRVLMARRNRGEWVVYLHGLNGDPPVELDVPTFARWARRGLA